MTPINVTPTLVFNTKQFNPQPDGTVTVTIMNPLPDGTVLDGAQGSDVVYGVNDQGLPTCRPKGTTGGYQNAKVLEDKGLLAFTPGGKSGILTYAYPYIKA